MGYKIYHDKVFVPWYPRAQADILKSIDKERNSEAQDRYLAIYCGDCIDLYLINVTFCIL